MTTKEVISRLTDEAERCLATPDDEDGMVREVLRVNGLDEKRECSAAVWLLVCCELADRRAQRLGYKNEVARALDVAETRIAMRRHGSTVKHPAP